MKELNLNEINQISGGVMSFGLDGISPADLSGVQQAAVGLIAIAAAAAPGGLATLPFLGKFAAGLVFAASTSLMMNVYNTFTGK